MYFVDSSALIKAYVSESGTPMVKAALGSLGGDVCVSSVVVIETASALARLRRTLRMRQKVYARVREKFLNDCKTQFYVVHPPQAVVGTTVGMIDQYRMRSPGGSDLLHLATAEHVQRLLPGQTISFMCCDLALRSVAEERGFDVFDPLRDPLSALLPPTAPGEN
jgi:predicted nucleic acid-binding protein